MNTGAFCKTEAVQTFKSLLKQRRRWFLGFITNEVCMLTDIRLWKRYPLLLVIRLAQNTIRTTALLSFTLVISLLTTSQKISNLPVGFIAVSLGLNWILMIYFAAKLGRYKVILYPLMFVVNPAFNWLYMVVSMISKADLVNANLLPIVWCLHRRPAYVGRTQSRCRKGRRKNNRRTGRR
jgi:chitin synthase